MAEILSVSFSDMVLSLYVVIERMKYELDEFVLIRCDEAKNMNGPGR